MVAFKSRHDLDKVVLDNPGGLRIELLTNGVLFGIYHDQVMINQFLGYPLEGNIQNIYLRVHQDGRYIFTSLMGPLSSSGFRYYSNSALWYGIFQEIPINVG